MNSSALSSIPFSGNNSSFGFHCFAGIQLDTATGSLKSLSTYTTSLRFFLNKQPLFRRMKKTRESLSRTFSLDRWLERRKCLSEVDALYLVWCLVLDPRSLWKLAVKLFQALLAGKSLILRQDMTLKIVEIERVKRDEKKNWWIKQRQISRGLYRSLFQLNSDARQDRSGQ